MQNQKSIGRVAEELGLSVHQVAGALALFDEGNTLPFIARYRKEATGGLDEIQLRDLRDRAQYLRELEDRRAQIIASIDEQGKLDPELRSRIEAAETKQALEDLYLPYRPRRRTRATIARERGLEPLAEMIWGGSATDTEVEAAAPGYIDEEKGVATAADALQGARDILAERVSEDAELRGWVRELTQSRGLITSRAAVGKEGEVSNYQDYYEFSQKLTEIPSHRMLAIRRGEAEEYLFWSIEAPVDEIVPGLERRVLAGRRAESQLRMVVQDSYKRLLSPSIEVELRLELKNLADADAIGIFGLNLEQLLLAAPAGERVVLGLDPGYRTGVKVAAVSRTGAVLETETLYLHQSDRFARGLAGLLERHDVELIAIGNGTASRETESAARAVVRDLEGTRAQVVVVNEAGASVYSASELARDELPGLDVSLRGAVSIARRLQDPLAELVKIDPKSIGVGQYQHDVNQTRLKSRLDEVVEICVNRVGVEVNTASASLLSYVSGIGPALAQNIVKLRDERGGFRSRKELLDVPRLGARAFEQAAGFLRVREGEHPLDSSAVHPERYHLVERIAGDLGSSIVDLVANEGLLSQIELQRYIGDDVGLPTLQDIVEELKKPGRDPRATFEPPAFREDVREVKDLKEGMTLEGVVTNIVAFGAFVDIGVHQDGLVHISQLADKFVSDPTEVVRVGEKVRVRVVSVDLERNRIGLSMRKDAGAAAEGSGSRRGGGRRGSSDNSGGERQGRRKRGQRQEQAPRVPKPGEIAANGIRFR